MERSVQMSFSTVLSAAIEGLSAEFVDVEADVSNGLPVFHMAGLSFIRGKRGRRTGPDCYQECRI